MIALSNYNNLTPEEYLQFEEKSPIKHEYIDGQVYAMAGTTDTHNIIGLNFTFITPAMTETETVYWLAFEPLRSREPKQKRMLV
ncbi:MAG: Uma2 family endonuclease [Dolichospermum sp.]|jgi:Uma2 family endonuclease|uniref:Uma2 family endonuclease n=1 Tax=Microcystis TaxID=1125 RepID=UPI00391CAF1E